MAHVVTEKCEGCKFTECVEVCPVACFYELDERLVINPEECIDCTACVAECPVQAIFSENVVPREFEVSIHFNAEASARLRSEGRRPIIQKKEPLPTAKRRQAELS